MTYETYIEITAPMIEQYHNAMRVNCPRVANARLRKISKVYAEYQDISYEEALEYIQTML